MATQLPPIPLPPPSTVRRFDESGRPTPAQVNYETALKRFLDALKSTVESM